MPLKSKSKKNSKSQKKPKKILLEEKTSKIEKKKKIIKKNNITDILINTRLLHSIEQKEEKTYETIEIVKPEDRQTSDIMTKFEYTRVVAIRAQQISEGGQVFTDVSELEDFTHMAEKEIADKKCPLMIERGLYNTVELWNVNEMGIPKDVKGDY